MAEAASQRAPHPLVALISSPGEPLTCGLGCQGGLEGAVHQSAAGQWVLGCRIGRWPRVQPEKTPVRHPEQPKSRPFLLLVIPGKDQV